MKLELQLVLIGIGGAIGAITRFGIAEASRHWFGSGFPIGTLIANLTGCFLVGILIGSGHAEKYDALRLGVGAGFLGALTTFSTFGAETIKCFDEGQYSIAFANIGMNVVLGLVFVVLGIVLAKKFS